MFPTYDLCKDVKGMGTYITTYKFQHPQPSRYQVAAAGIPFTSYISHRWGTSAPVARVQYASLFHISGMDGRIMLTFGAWLGIHYISVFHVLLGGNICI